jgi:hypothetical protein
MSFPLYGTVFTLLAQSTASFTGVVSPQALPDVQRTFCKTFLPKQTNFLSINVRQLIQIKLREILFDTVLTGYDFRDYFGPKTLKIKKQVIALFYETFLTAVANQSVCGDVKSDCRICIFAVHGGSSLPHAVPGIAFT